MKSSNPPLALHFISLHCRLPGPLQSEHLLHVSLHHPSPTAPPPPSQCGPARQLQITTKKCDLATFPWSTLTFASQFLFSASQCLPLPAMLEHRLAPKHKRSPMPVHLPSAVHDFAQIYNEHKLHQNTHFFILRRRKPPRPSSPPQPPTVP